MATHSVSPVLPVDAHREALLKGLAATGRLILVAPPGTGKSTRVPPMVLAEEGAGKIAVLQPRRIAARNLAWRVAQEMGCELGGEVGYQVRFESRISAKTRIVYQTHGLFFQGLLQAPTLPDVAVVIFDEFHERALESDAALAHCLRLQATARPDLKLVVMSATLESARLQEYLAPCSLVEVASPLHPVEIRHQSPVQNEPVWNAAQRAARTLLAQGLTAQRGAGAGGSVLVFMPGTGEIRRTCEALDPLARQAGMSVHELHGGMDLDAQQKALQAPQRGPCFVVSTNVAETSLTLPGISTVIDSGLQRIASYNPERDMDTLYLKSISLHSATQRAGRAGRLGPGLCMRLWSPERERAMPQALEPEVRRVDLTPLALKLLALEESMRKLPEVPPWHWLDAPGEALWSHALGHLERIGAMREEGITPLGRALLRWNVHPVPARALLAAHETGDPLIFDLVAAMCAVLETDSRRHPQASSDLYVLGRDLVRDPKDRQVDPETRESWRRLRALGTASDRAGGRTDRKPWPKSWDGEASAEAAEAAGPEVRESVTRCFLPAFVDRLASRIEQTQSFALADGRKGVADARSAPTGVQALLALEMHETGGAGKARQITLPTVLPVEAEWVKALWPDDVKIGIETVWDESRGAGKGRQVQEERWVFRGLVLRRKTVEQAAGVDATEVLVEKLMSGEYALPGFDDAAWQVVHRIRLAAATCPDMGLPKLDDDDWRLIYHEICDGKSSLKQIEDASVVDALRDYLGYTLWQWLEREAPSSLALPGGKRARITYSEKGPPEMSARLGDFVGMQGKTFILQKRVTVNYDILAPNYRTVQKTQDLTSFWQNTYPEVKKELKRRYPRHPWP